LLKGRGYRTAAFVGSIQLDPHNGMAQGFDRGFQTYDAGFRMMGGATGGSAQAPARSGLRPGLAARSSATTVSLTQRSTVVARAVSWLTRNGQGSFFLWVHLHDPSIPGTSYNAAITAVDAAVGKLLATLKQQKLYGNTAVLVVADHGQSLGAHGED